MGSMPMMGTLSEMRNWMSANASRWTWMEDHWSRVSWWVGHRWADMVWLHDHWESRG
jgi:hypothetical protein